MRKPLRSLIQKGLLLYRRRQVFVRLLLVWALGLLIFNYDERNSFDFRFQLRSEQTIDPKIVIIQIEKKSWDKVINPDFPALLKSARPLSDSYFWSSKIWHKLLSTIEQDSPHSITVDLFFDRSVPMSWNTENSFKRPGVIWRAEPDERFGYKNPRFAINVIQKKSRSERSLLNVGLGQIYRDYDYTARRYQKTSYGGFLNDLSSKTAELVQKGATNYLAPGLIPFINYRGPKETYPTLSLETVLAGYYPKGFFKNKIILIGSNAMKKHFVKTPIGEISRTEYLANVIDNILNKRWIRAFSWKSYALYLFSITLLCFLTLYYFRQGFAISCLILILVLSTALSIILFDIYNIWSPILSPIATIIISYIIMLNHLLTRSEYQAWAATKKEESTREINELKNNFVSLFSHDLKTPLAKIHALSDQMLQSKPLQNNQVVEASTKIQKETEELNRYIQSILQVTRIEAGEFNLNITPQDVNELIQSCIQFLSPLSSKKNISIHFTEEPLFPIEMDAALIREVFLNILDNSIKYCPKGSHIEIRSLDKESQVQVVFSDNGPGVPEKEQSAIFEKFYRAKQNDNKGTGLGLYLVKYFIETHHGTIDLQSSPGAGTSFIIDLPYEQPSGGLYDTN